MTTSRRTIGLFAPAVVALGLLLCACSPSPSHRTPPPLSAAQLAQAQAGTLQGRPEDADRLSDDYLAHRQHDPDRRRWMSRAAATGSSQAIQNYVDLLSRIHAPADCVEARALITRTKTRYKLEIAAATTRAVREARMEALETLRARERRMAEDGCRTLTRPDRKVIHRGVIDTRPLAEVARSD
ncbi:hypothetical protein [Caulobacter soli]|uniref:hypothetical protein n=1 Tax=Caulobacter soli TaxID=2708539 RepID=UPI0013EB25A9|nr:hypothetical protein [Caulobacter soli]